MPLPWLTWNPDVIYVAKNKSPLLIGLGEGYNMVCPDAMAMIRETNQYMEIHDQELVIVGMTASKTMMVTVVSAC